MFDLDKWNEIYATVRRHKLRTALTAFGVFWGIFMLILLMGAGKGLENGVMQSFNIAKNTVFLWSQRTGKEYQGFKAGRFIRFTNDDVAAIRNQVPEVAVLAPRNMLQGSFEISRMKKTASFEVYGDHPDFIQVQAMEIPEGRFINARDLAERRKVIVIGERVRELLFEPGEEALGSYIKIAGISFKVVGVFKSSAKGENKMREEQTIYMPLTTMQQAYNQGNRIFWFAFVPQTGIPAAVVEQKVKTLLAQHHHVAPDDVKAFGSANVELEYQQIQGLFTGIRGFSWFVSIFTIIAGVIGVGNIMLIVVRERTKEIGIRKALGATPWSIISLIIQESVVITTVAGYIGLMAGVGLVELINYALSSSGADLGFFANPEVDMGVALTATVVLILAGALAGFVPAAKAAAIQPIVALRDE
ncbi:ABC transporter permease [Eisenibacter elegans]|jgi:putative ABC transport system permease protein|uniref:ABC transporter permease n=1 Tax=Eisenibacter elegans TaxID=997 RepID=UPI0003F7D41D|nr:ABC transporter permease [Eisenibacter elegans]